MDKDVLSQVRKLKALPGIGEYKIGFTGSYARGLPLGTIWMSSIMH